MAKLETFTPPAPYGTEGLDNAIRSKFGCDSKHVGWYDPATPIPGFVHLFRLIDHDGAEECFVIPVPREDGGRDIYSYLVKGTVKKPEDALQQMLADRSDG